MRRSVGSTVDTGVSGVLLFIAMMFDVGMISSCDVPVSEECG